MVLCSYFEGKESKLVYFSVRGEVLEGFKESFDAAIQESDLFSSNH